MGPESILHGRGTTYQSCWEQNCWYFLVFWELESLDITYKTEFTSFGQLRSLFYARKSTSTLGWGTNNTLPTIFPVIKLVEAANQMLPGRSNQQRTFGYSDNLLLFSFLPANCCLSNSSALPLASCQTYFLFCFAFSISLSWKLSFQDCFLFSWSFPNSWVIFLDITITINTFLFVLVLEVPQDHMRTTPALLTQLGHSFFPKKQKFLLSCCQINREKQQLQGQVWCSLKELMTLGLNSFFHYKLMIVMASKHSGKFPHIFRNTGFRELDKFVKLLCQFPC